jgi:NADH dehydrogenase FAD-containing subunit
MIVSLGDYMCAVSELSAEPWFAQTDQGERNGDAQALQWLQMHHHAHVFSMHYCAQRTDAKRKSLSRNCQFEVREAASMSNPEHKATKSKKEKKTKEEDGRNVVSQRRLTIVGFLQTSSTVLFGTMSTLKDPRNLSSRKWIPFRNRRLPIGICWLLAKRTCFPPRVMLKS